MEEKILRLLHAPSKEHQQLGWILDKMQNQGKIKQRLEKEYANLLAQSSGGTIEELFQAKRIIYHQPTAKIIQVQQLPNINTLSCQKHRQLQEFLISDCPNLEYLYCFANPQLVRLTIRNCPNLLYLSCINNQLIELHLEETPKLVHLYAYSNQLTTFDVSRYPQLFGLDFTKNPMQQLIVTVAQQEKLRPRIERDTQLISI